MIERKKISEQVVEAITSMVKDGTFPPDSKIPSENELSKLLGVSRSPLRGALGILVASGILESKQGGGRWVRSTKVDNLIGDMSYKNINWCRIIQLFELRTIIELEAAALAAERKTNEDLHMMEKYLNEYKESLEKSDDTSTDVDLNFHRAIIRSTKNPVLEETFDNIQERFRKFIDIITNYNHRLRTVRKSAYEEHVKIFQAIQNNDPEAARNHMRQHHIGIKMKLEILREEVEKEHTITKN